MKMWLAVTIVICLCGQVYSDIGSGDGETCDGMITVCVDSVVVNGNFCLSLTSLMMSDELTVTVMTDFGNSTENMVNINSIDSNGTLRLCLSLDNANAQMGERNITIEIADNMTTTCTYDTSVNLSSTILPTSTTPVSMSTAMPTMAVSTTADPPTSIVSTPTATPTTEATTVSTTATTEATTVSTTANTEATTVSTTANTEATTVSTTADTEATTVSTTADTEATEATTVSRTATPSPVSTEFIIAMSIIGVLIVLFLALIFCLSCVLYIIAKRRRNQKKKPVVRWADTEQGNVELLAMTTILEKDEEGQETSVDEKINLDKTEGEDGVENDKKNEAVTVGTFGFQEVVIEGDTGEKPTSAADLTSGDKGDPPAAGNGRDTATSDGQTKTSAQAEDSGGQSVVKPPMETAEGKPEGTEPKETPAEGTKPKEKTSMNDGPGKSNQLPAGERTSAFSDNPPSGESKPSMSDPPPTNVDTSNKPPVGDVTPLSSDPAGDTKPSIDPPAAVVAMSPNIMFMDDIEKALGNTVGDLNVDAGTSL